MKNEPHPIEALLVVALLVVEALATLVAALVALQQCCRKATPAPAPAPTAPPPPPHPLQALSLAPAGTVAQLRRRARVAGLPPSLARNGRREALLSALAGLEVAMI